MLAHLTSRTGRFFSSLAAIFRPPFEGLWLVVLLYGTWCHIVYPHSQILRGNFPDPDDYMYLVQVMDWLGGAGWYDNIQHRINPPDGILIHFSRLAMVPMAGMVWIIEKLGLGPRGASMLMATFYPLILLGGFLITMRRVAANFMPRDWAGVTAYVALFATALMYMFQPGHVDHHGLIIWIVAIALGCAARMMLEPGDLRWGLGAGLALAFGLTIALEMLPWVLLVSGVLGLWAVVEGRKAARHGLVFALALHAASILFLLLTRPPGGFFTPDVLTYSIVYVMLTGGIAVSFAAVAAAAEVGIAWRAILGAVFGGLCGFLFLYRFPTLAGGPYAAMDPELQDIILNGVSEAMPLTQKLGNPIALACYLSSTVLAMLASVYFLSRARKRERWAWGLLTVLLIAGFLLTTFYQCRFGGTMQMFAVIPLAVLLQRGWQWIGAHFRSRKKIYAELGLVLLVGPLLNVILPALQDGRSFNTGVILFPVVGNFENPCDTWVLERALRDSLSIGDHPRLIISEMGLGPELLFRTPHSVLAAPFFDTEGNMDAYRFFSTPYPDEAKAIALRRHVDLVVTCRTIPLSYMREAISQTDLTVKKDFAPHFVERLIVGKTPDWLHRVNFEGLKNYVIYEVVPPKDKKAKSGP